jgi:hypothetical protein
MFHYVVTSAETPQAASPIHGIKAYQTSDALEVQPTHTAEPQYRMNYQADNAEVQPTLIAPRAMSYYTDIHPNHSLIYT